MQTLVLGIGNLLLGDEGVGCRCVQELERRYTLPPEVQCVDGGTAGFELLPLVEDTETLIIIDALTDGRAQALYIDFRQTLGGSHHIGGVNGLVG